MTALRRLLAIATIVVLAVPSVYARSTPRDSRIVETVRADVVNVDVVVVDKDGSHVTDLTADDFEIRENGDPVEVTNFAVFRGAPDDLRVVAGAGAAQAPAVAPPVALDPDTDPHRLRLVVVFDNFFTSVPSRLRALNRLEPFLEETLRGNAEVMIVSAGRRMGVALPFTEDPRAVSEVVGRVARATTESASRADQAQSLESLFEEALLEGRDTTGLESFAEALGFEERGEVLALLEMLGHVVDSLAGLEGRKAVLFVSDGFPVRPGDSPVFRDTVGSRYDVYGDLADLTRRANGNRVVFHTLRPSGLQTSIPGAEVGRLSGRGGGRGAVYDQARIDRTANTRSGLVDLATATGGRVLFEGNRIESFLTEVAGDLTTYYSLGYRRPAATEKTRYRKIDVRVKRKGVDVLHRKGDFAKTEGDALEDRIRSAALLGRASNELGLEIVVDRAIPLDDGRFQVPVLIPVPLDEVALLPRGDDLAGGFRLLVGTVSTRGSMDPVQEFGYDVVVPAAQMEGDGANRTYPAMFTLELPSGPVFLAVAFVDDLGATPSIATGNFVLRRETETAGTR